MRYAAFQRLADGRVVERQRVLGYVWYCAPELRERLETLKWEAACEAMRRAAAQDGRVLVVPSLVTRACAENPSRFETRGTCVPEAPTTRGK